MYCKHCGKEIDDNSSFCKHCGKPQNGNLKGFRISIGWIIYFIWTFANFYLLIGIKDKWASDTFFPFTYKYHYNYSNTLFIDYKNWDKYFYDFSEFIVYVFIIPAVLYLVYRLFHTKIDNFINKLLKK